LKFSLANHTTVGTYAKRHWPHYNNQMINQQHIKDSKRKIYHTL